jgi:D-alanyl-D-alanine carboxypeptidase/D-alanyl-D-alanine-endopeptidase (penicillin-binding protein 4)
MKLLTTGAAAAILGPDMFFRTEIRRDGSRIVVVGDGDPGLGDPRLLAESSPRITVDDMIAALGKAAANAGAGKIEEIIIDDRIFDRTQAHPSWPEDQLNRWYCAEVAGLNFHTNCLTFYFEPTRPESQPSISVAPGLPLDADWLSITNDARTIEKGQNTVWIARPRPQNLFRLIGDVRKGSAAEVDVAMHDPQLLAGYMLAHDLRKRGGLAPGQVRKIVRLAEDREDLAGGKTVAEVRTSLRDVLTRSNRDSQNLYTEALIKRIGHEVTGEPGSWTNGAAVVRMLVIERLGPEFAQMITVADGSGMSRDNTIAPALVTSWLASLYTDENTAIADAMLSSMAEVGQGTLRDRFAGAAVSNAIIAKTGSIRGVRCMSGYVVDTSNPSNAVCFSVLINDLGDGRSTRAAKRLHEQIALAVDEWMTENRPAPRAMPLGG